jgi:Rrf2 family protein
MLSQTAEYALRTILFLGEHQDRPLVRVGELAETLGIPRNYLSKTLHQLARAGVLASSRGKLGGFRLARPAERISLAEVIAPFDGPTGARTCLLGRAVCSDQSPCAAHARWKGVSSKVSDFFRETTVAQLLGSGGSRRS